MKGAINVSRAVAAVAIGIFLTAYPLAAPADTVEVFAGAQADFANYVFAGASVALLFLLSVRSLVRVSRRR